MSDREQALAAIESLHGQNFNGTNIRCEVRMNA